MKRTLLSIGITTIISFIAAGCSDGQLWSGSASDIPPPEGSAAAATVVSRGDLVEALWATEETSATEAPAEGEAEEATATANVDADCLAQSSFVVRGTTAFMIQRNAAPTEMNSASVVIVSSINITIPEDGDRAASCGSGEKAYIVTASEDLPIDIVLAEGASVQESPEGVAQDDPTPYPDKCDIAAHFEQHGAEGCDPVEENESPEQTPEEEPTVSENGNPGDGDQEQPDVSLNREEGAPPPESAEEAGACDAPAVKTLKLVVESTDCVVNTFVQQP